MDADKPTHRWFHLTPGRVVLLLLAIEVLLWASDRFGWLPKGWPILIAIASVAAVMLAMFVWFGVALVFRKRFQFSLRSLLLLVVAVALPFSWLAVEMKKAREQKLVVEALAAYNLVPWYDWEEEFHHGRNRQEPPGPVWLRSVFGDEFFADIVGVAGRSGSPEGKGRADFGRICEHLSRLPRLRGLALWDYDPMTDADLARLRDLASLRELELDASQFTDTGMKHLGELHELEVLMLCSGIECNRITDAGFRHFTGLRRLRELGLYNSRVGDAGLHELQGLTALQALHLNGTQVTDEGVAKLQQALPNCKITR